VINPGLEFIAKKKEDERQALNQALDALLLALLLSPFTKEEMIHCDKTRNILERQMRLLKGAR